MFLTRVLLLSAVLCSSAEAQQPPAQISAWIVKSGTLIVFGACSPQAAPNGAYPVAAIAALKAIPTVYRNGTAITLGPAVWASQRLDSPLVFYRLPDRAKPEEVYTYDAPANWIIPVNGGRSVNWVWRDGTPMSVAAVKDGTVDNWVGRLEGPSGGFRCFDQKPRLIAGVNVGAQPVDPNKGNPTWKNRLHSSGNWECNGGGKLTLASDGWPDSWTLPEKSTLRNWCHGPIPPWSAIAGRWTLQYDDPGAGTPTAMKLFLSSRYSAKTISSTIEVFGDRKTVTNLYDIVYPPNPPTTELDVALYARAPAGPDGKGHWTVDNVRVVAPDVRDGSAIPITPGESDLEPDPNALRDMTGVGLTRWMDSVQGWGGNSDWVLPTDPMDPTDFSWRKQKTYDVRFQFARYYSTTASPRVYGPQSVFTEGPDDFGKYLNLSVGDDGAFACGSDGGVVELRSTAPHGLITGRTIHVWVEAGGVPVPFGSLTAPFAPTNPQGCPAFVTGPNTLLVTLYLRSFLAAGSTASAQPRRVIGTSEIDLTAGGTKAGWRVYGAVPSSPSGAPYRYPPAFARGLPGSILWVNLPIAATDDLVAGIARETARELGPTNRIYLEDGNEVWNAMIGQQQWLLPLKQLGVGPVNADMYGPYVPMAAHAFEVFTSQAAKVGIDPSRIEYVYGGWFNGSYRTQQIVAVAKAAGARVDHIAIAPYHDTPADPTIVTAFKSWPPDAINDFTRHIVAYSATYQKWWREHATHVRASVQAKKPDLVCYEGSLQTIIPAGVGNASTITWRCLTDPSARDLIYGWFAAQQQGDQTSDDGGATAACYYQAYNSDTPWILSRGVGQSTPAMQGLRDWAAATGPPPMPIPPK